MIHQKVREKVKYTSLLLLFSLVFLITGWDKDEKQKEVVTYNNDNCRFKGHQLYGKIKYVESFPDLKVQVVSSLPDLRVQVVTGVPDKCGKWQIVNKFPDLKVQIVDAFPDIKIQYVDAFPGLVN